MRKIILTIFLATIIFTSCAEDKPFTVVDKQYNGQDYSYYTLQDGEGQIWIIEDTADAYKIGDTIK